MNLVFFGLVVIALFIHGNENQSALDFPRANAKRKACVIQIDSANDFNNQGLNCNQKTTLKTTFECGRCSNGKEFQYRAVCHHMHTLDLPCFPKNGLACGMCINDAPRSFNALEMFKHNKEYHANDYYWPCRFCNSRSSQDNWIKHLGYYTKIRDALTVFEGWPDRELKVFKNSKSLAHIDAQIKATALTSSRHTVDQEAIAIMVLYNLSNNK